MMCIDVTTEIVEKAMRKGNQLGYEYGFRCAILRAQRLALIELPGERGAELALKLQAIEPEAQP